MAQQLRARPRPHDVSGWVKPRHARLAVDTAETRIRFIV
jgi:hypothetical protein